MHWLPKYVIFAVVPQMATPIASASQGQLADRDGTLTGVAIDSIRGGYLRGAIVSVLGTDKTAITDSLGHFHIDGIAIGQHAVEILHPILDTIGIRLSTAPKEFRGGDTVTLLLSTPSANTVVSLKCSTAKRAEGPAALIGMVLDAATERPVTGSSVVLWWTDYVIGKKEIKSTPHEKKVEVSPDGHFAICGLPNDLRTGALAFAGSDTTAARIIDLFPYLAIASFRLEGPPPEGAPSGPEATSRANSQPVTSPPRGAIAGTVRDISGKSIDGARISDTEGLNTSSDAAGQFRLDGIRRGTRAISIRRLGYEPVEMVVDVPSGRAAVLSVSLNKVVPVLKSVTVTAMRDLGLQRVGFSERKAWGMGTYITPDQIESRNAMRLVNLLETLPVMRAGADDRGRRYVTGRYGGCVRYFVDGVRWYTKNENEVEELPDAYLSTAEIGAIEVYSGNFAPGQFYASSRDGLPCTSVVVWTKFKLGF